MMCAVLFDWRSTAECCLPQIKYPCNARAEFNPSDQSSRMNGLVLFAIFWRIKTILIKKLPLVEQKIVDFLLLHRFIAQAGRQLHGKEHLYLQ
jgi:hypothetical protein